MGLPLEKPRRCTVSEYLEIERVASERHEYRDGEILAMAGGTYEHSVIVLNAGSEIRAALKGKPCRASDANLRVRIQGTPMYVYPDISVICGQAQFDPADAARQTVTNPRLVVEVLSPSTEAYDRGGKFTAYRRIDSFQEYVLISQDEARVETFFRQADGTWLFSSANGLEARIPLRCLGVELSLNEIYAGIEFPPAPEQSAIHPETD